MPRKELRVIEAVIKRHIRQFAGGCSDKRKNQAMLEGVGLPRALQYIAHCRKPEKQCRHQLQRPVQYELGIDWRRQRDERKK